MGHNRFSKWRHVMKRSYVYVLLIVAALLCFVGCNDNSVVRYGTLEINIESDVSKGIQAVSMDTASYNVTVKSSTGNILFSSSKSTKTSYTISVPAGTCTIEIEALNKAGDVIGIGSTSGEITPDVVNRFNITVGEPDDGTGVFSISVKGEYGHTLEYRIVSADSEFEKTGNCIYMNGAYSAEITLPKGYYTFQIIWKEMDLPVKTDTLRVIWGKTAVYDAQFLFLIDGSVSITNEVKGTPSISLSGKRLLTVDDSLSVISQISGITNYTCKWAIDEVILEDSNSESLSYALTDFREGEHTATLFVSAGNVVWSETMKFEVLPDRDTEIEVSGDVEVWLVGDVLLPYRLRADCFFDDSRYFTLESSSGNYERRNIGNNTRTMRCSLNYPDYVYYLRSEYDSERNVTVVEVVIDKYIEDPAYINVDIETEYTLRLDHGERGGLVLRSSSIIEPLANINGEERCYLGFVTINNKNGVRTVKVEPCTYTPQNDWWWMNDWFCLQSDKTSLTLSRGETGSLLFTEKEPNSVVVQLPDSYEEGTEFTVINRENYNLSNNSFTIKVKQNQQFNYTVLPTKDRDCYYTVSIQPGATNVNAVRHESAFYNTGIEETSGNYYINFVSDCLIPIDMHFSYRIGDYYDSELRRVVENCFGSTRLADCYGSDIEIWIDETDFCRIDSVTTTTEGYNTYITVHITSTYANNGTINVSYDFGFDINNDRQTFIEVGSGKSYFLLITDKSKTNIKAIPGTYNVHGWTRIIRADEVNYRPTIQASNFVVSAGSNVDVHVVMQPN